MCETLGTAGAMQLTDEITIHAATETTVSLMYPQGHRPFHQLFNGDCLPTFFAKKKMLPYARSTIPSFCLQHFLRSM